MSYTSGMSHTVKFAQNTPHTISYTPDTSTCYDIHSKYVIHHGGGAGGGGGSNNMEANSGKVTHYEAHSRKVIHYETLQEGHAL